MKDLMVIVFGCIAGFGAVLFRLGWRGVRWSPSHNFKWPKDKRILRSVAVGCGVGTTLYLATNWLLSSFVTGVVALLTTYFSSGATSSRRDEHVAEAVALWAEQLRDTLAAAHGLQQTIVATAPHAPQLIAPHVQRLAADLPYGSMSGSLRTFAREVGHPSADFVVAALIAATEHEARDVGALLGHLATCAREEAKMHQRVWVSRARTRTAVRIIVSTVVGFVGALFLLNREYLQPYGTATGQVVLCGILGVFAFALVLLQKGSAVPMPDRFVASGTPPTSSSRVAV